MLPDGRAGAAEFELADYAGDLFPGKSELMAPSGRLFSRGIVIRTAQLFANEVSDHVSTVTSAPHEGSPSACARSWKGQPDPKQSHPGDENMSKKKKGEIT